LRINKFLERLIDNWPAKIISLAVALVLFLFYRIINLEERFVNVPLELAVPKNFTPAGNYPKKVRVTLRGSEEEIFRILEEDIEAVVDLTKYSSEGIYREAVKIAKRGTALSTDMLEITVDPMEVTVALERKMKKSLEVVPDITGFPAKGYELSQFFITPSTVEVEGPESQIADLESIPTEEIDISGKQEDFTVRVPLIIDEGITILSGESVVEFHGVIHERVILKTFENIDIVTLDLEPDLNVVSAPSSGTIQVQGTQNVLFDTDPGQLQLVVDCSGIASPGTYTLPVKPDAPIGLLILNYQPQQAPYVIEWEEAEEE
jgi:YbbR domain-containing protein